jgi:hypothetical protein
MAGHYQVCCGVRKRDAGDGGVYGLVARDRLPRPDETQAAQVTPNRAIEFLTKGVAFTLSEGAEADGLRLPHEPWSLWQTPCTLDPIGIAAHMYVFVEEMAGGTTDEE